MRFLWLGLLGVVSYLVAMIVLFPAAPVVDRFRSQLGPVALNGVHGNLLNGVIDEVRSTDDLLPLSFQNVSWRLAPRTLLAGSAGATISFDGYGGGGQAVVSRRWDGDVHVNDLQFTAQARALDVLLPVPVASFSGELEGRIERVELSDNLLQAIEGVLTWRNAALQSPVPTSLGMVNVLIRPEGVRSHVITLTAEGGDVLMDGSVTLTLDGDFVADVLFTPVPGAPQPVVNGLRQMGRPDAQGRVRLQRQGNVNRLM